VLQDNEVEFPGGPGDVAHAGIGGTVGLLQLDAANAVGHATLNLAHDGAFAERGIEIAEEGVETGMAGGEPDAVVVDLGDLRRVLAPAVTADIAEDIDPGDPEVPAVADDSRLLRRCRAGLVPDGVGVDVENTHGTMATARGPWHRHCGFARG